MNLDTVTNFFKTHAEELEKKYHVQKIGVFGSYAKHQENLQSDIDLYVTFSKKSFRNLAGLYDFCENAFEKKVDIVTEHKNLRPALRREIESSIIYG